MPTSLVFSLSVKIFQNLNKNCQNLKNLTLFVLVLDRIIKYRGRYLFILPLPIINVITNLSLIRILMDTEFADIIVKLKNEM